jgi:hypothetical protein
MTDKINKYHYHHNGADLYVITKYDPDNSNPIIGTVVKKDIVTKLVDDLNSGNLQEKDICYQFSDAQKEKIKKNHKDTMSKANEEYDNNIRKACQNKQKAEQKAEDSWTKIHKKSFGLLAHSLLIKVD